MKKKLILFFTLLLLAGCKEKIKAEWNADKVEAEYTTTLNEEIENLFLKSTNADCTYVIEDIEGNETELQLGKNIIHFTLTLNDQKEEEYKTLTLTDTTAPGISVAKEEYTIGYMEKEPEVTFTFSDNYSKEEKLITSIKKEEPEGRIGDEIITATCSDEAGNKTEKTVILHIIDDVPPSIIGVDQDYVITAGDTYDLNKTIKGVDEIDGEITVEFENDWNSKQAGTYPIKAIATDSSGNTTEVEFNFVVKEPTTSSTTTVNYTGTTSKGYTIEIKDGITYIDGYLIVNKTYALPSTYKPSNTHASVSGSDFVLEGLTEETYAAWLKLQSAAAQEGLNLYISSGFRSYNYQSGLYNNYVNRDGKAAADTYSARPGHSEHQTGLCFDLNTISSAFADTAEGQWVNAHCAEYGFIIRYPKGKESETGYMYESWHIRYVGTDLASKLYNNGDWITMESYFGITSEYQE